MKHKVINDDQERTHVIILETGEEVITQLEKFCQDNNISAARINAIGAFSQATLAYYNWEKKEYEKIPVQEQVEVLMLAGDVTLQDGTPHLHIHAVLGKRDGSAHGGHLLGAYVRPTLEVMLIESPDYLKRKLDAESGLPLIDTAL